MENKFQTMSSSRKSVKTVFITWVVMAVAALFALKITVIACIFLEVIILFTCLFCAVLTSKTKWKLSFDGTVLTMTNTANHRQFCLENLKHSDFLFLQKENQESKNCGDLKIVGFAAAGIYDVQNFSELKAYIDRNFN